jgi:hypothetical protein
MIYSASSVGSAIAAPFGLVADVLEIIASPGECGIRSMSALRQTPW